MKIFIPEKNRERHMHVVGANGSGKSRFLRSLIQQDIRNKRGVCLIDPHGALCQDVVKWLADKPLLAKHRKIRVFNIGEGEDILSFNPLFVNDIERETSTAASRLADAIGRLFSKEDLQEQPRTFEVLTMLFVTLAEHGMSLGDFHILLNPKYRKERQYLVSQLKSTNTKRQWQLLDNYRDNEFTEYVGSVSRRLYTLLENPIIRSSLSVKKNAIDFGKSMDDGEILLFNLRGTTRLDTISSQLFGLLLISSFFIKTADRKNIKPFYLYIDESYRYLSDRLAEMFEECRKDGLHLILAHQNMGQLRAAGERIFSTVMSEAIIKVVFHMREPDDAEYLARAVFGSMIDPNKIKEVLSKPTVVGYTIKTLLGYSVAVGRSSTSGSGSSSGSAASSGLSVTQLPPSFTLEGADTSITEMTGTAASSMSNTFSVEASSYSEGSSKAQTYLPVLETMPTATVPIDDQLFVLANELSSLKTQYGVIKGGEGEALVFKALDTPDVRPYSKRLEKYIERITLENPYTIPREEALSIAEVANSNMFSEIKNALERSRVKRKEARANKESKSGNWE